MTDTLFAAQSVLHALTNTMRALEQRGTGAEWTNLVRASDTQLKRAEDLFRVYAMTTRRHGYRRAEIHLREILRVMFCMLGAQKSKLPVSVNKRVILAKALYTKSSATKRCQIDRAIYKLLLTSTESLQKYQSDTILTKYAEAVENQKSNIDMDGGVHRDLCKTYEQALVHHSICAHAVQNETISNTASMLLSLRHAYSFLNTLVPSDSLLCLIMLFIGEDTAYHATDSSQRCGYAILGLHECLQPSLLHDRWPILACAGDQTYRIPEILRGMKACISEGKEGFKQKVSAVKTHLSHVSRLAHFLFTVMTHAPTSKDALLWLQNPIIPSDESICLTNRRVNRVVCAPHCTTLWEQTACEKDTVEMRDAKRVVRIHSTRPFRSAYWNFLKMNNTFEENVLANFPRAPKRVCPSWVR